MYTFKLNTRADQDGDYNLMIFHIYYYEGRHPWHVSLSLNTSVSVKEDQFDVQMLGVMELGGRLW